MKIAIIEDNSLMAEMLKDMVTEQPDWELVGIADNGRAFEREDNLFDIYNSDGSLISEGLTYY